MWHAWTMRDSVSWQLPKEVLGGPQGSWFCFAFSWWAYDNDKKKKISTVPIFHTEWKHRMLYNSNRNTYTPSHPHTHTHTHTHTHIYTHTYTRTHKHTHAHTTHGPQRQKTAVEKTDRLETVWEKVGFKSGFEWWRRIRVSDWQRLIVPDRWARIREWSFAE